MIDILDAFMKKFFLFWWKKVNLFKNEVLEIKAFKRLIYLPKTIVWFVDELPWKCIFHKKLHVTKNVWCTWSNWETSLSSTWPFWMYFMITCQQVKQLSFNCNYISNEMLSNKMYCNFTFTKLCEHVWSNKYSKYILQASKRIVLFGLEYVASPSSFVMFSHLRFIDKPILFICSKVMLNI